MMSNYKEMYLLMMKETEKAIEILIEAQRKCEEIYLKLHKPDLKIIDLYLKEKSEANEYKFD